MEAMEEQTQAKYDARQAGCQAQASTADSLYTTLPNSFQKAVEFSKESGASTAYRLTDRGTRFFPTQRSVSRCSVSSLWMATPTITISMCMRQDVQRGAYTKLPTWWFSTIHYNEIRDIAAQLMSDVCHNIGIEPPLQHITSETMSYRTANVEEGARLDIKAQGFWGNDRQCSFFDVRVFNPLTHTYRSLPMATCYRRNDQEKRRAYDQRVREVEHGCFSPLVFSVSGGMGPTAKVVYKKLAAMIASKYGQSYSQTINWLRCRLSFSLLRSSIMYLRGSRSSVNHPEYNHNIRHPMLQRSNNTRAYRARAGLGAI